MNTNDLFPTDITCPRCGKSYRQFARDPMLEAQLYATHGIDPDLCPRCYVRALREQTMTPDEIDAAERTERTIRIQYLEEYLDELYDRTPSTRREEYHNKYRIEATERTLHRLYAERNADTDE